MRCSKCNSENPEGKKFCGKCGTRLVGRCPKCGAENSPDNTFCGDCGAAISGNAAAPSPVSARTANQIRVTTEQTAASAAADGERKTVTALFADIKGSTELEQDLDPEEARAIVDPALKLMIDAVRRYDGYVVQSTGDGIFALFGAPVAHEDHPQRALYAALRMQEELRRYSAKLRETGNLPLEARVGVNTGEVVVRSITTGQGQTEYTPIGHTTNLASRMQALAPTGSIAISENTRRLVEGYFALKPLGPTRVKGVSEPVNVYEVVGLGPLRTRLQRSAGRGLTKFVGREREMEALKHAAEQALAGRGQIVAAIAEAGVGKSRLLFEFKAVARSGWTVLETFSVSHGKASAYVPVIDLLHGYFEIVAEDDARRRRQKVLGKLLELDRALEDTLPYLYGLLGIVEGDDPLAEMDAQVRKRRTLDAIKRLLLRESLNQPLMVIFEDLHWVDEETQGFLNLLADSIANTKILLLVNYRPEYSHQWSSRTYYTQLRLDPLGKESADEMLTALLGDGAEIAQLKRVIIEKTEGNPFFMEETVQVLFDDGALVRNGTVRLTKPLGGLKIPPTVQAILAARIDRLPAADKELLQTLAVIGKEFTLNLVRGQTGRPDDELNSTLAKLQLGEFIYEQPSVGDIEYSFKHALTHEVAYNSVLMERRKLLHERTAATIEGLFKDRLDDHLAELAHHYGRSANAAKAAEYLYRAARQATARFAYSEAGGYLGRALESLKRLPEDAGRERLELAIQLTLAGTLAVRSYALPEAGRAYARAWELCDRIGDPTQVSRALVGLWTFHNFRNELQKAREIAQRHLAIATEAGNASMSLIANYALGNTLAYLGEFASARERLEKAVTAFDARQRLPAALEIARVAAYGWLAQVLWFLGYSQEGQRRLREQLALAKESGQPLALAVALTNEARSALFFREASLARERAEQSVVICEHNGFSFFLAFAFCNRGAALACQGQGDEGVAEIRRGIAVFDAVGATTTFESAFLAEALGRSGKAKEGLALMNDVLPEVDKSGARMIEAEMRRLCGELLLAQDASNERAAADYFRTAIEVARAQSAKSWELRATTSLARLLAQQGKRDEARAMLAEIYGWFTEGFDTADLKDAKALLDELRA